MNLLGTPWLYRYTWAIGAITIASGAFQIAFTGWELDFLDAENTETTRHFFAIVGMFMVLFGGLVLHALRTPEGARTPLLWAALQKFGAAIAVGLGVMTDVFSPLASAVAGFDLLSGIVFMLYRGRL